MVAATSPICLQNVPGCGQITVRKQTAGSQDFLRKILQQRDVPGCRGCELGLASHAIETFEHHPARHKGRIETHGSRKRADCTRQISKRHAAIATLLVQETKFWVV